MRRRVEGHGIQQFRLDEEYKEQAARLDQTREVLPKRIQNTGSFLGRALNQLANSRALGQPRADARRWLMDARDLGVALFQAAPHRRQRVQVIFRGQPVEIQGGTHEYVTTDHWMRAWAVARLLRDVAALDALSAFEHRHFGPASSPILDPLVEALQLRHLGEPWEAAHDRFISMLQQYLRKDEIACARAWGNMLDAFDTTGRDGPDSAQFNDALYAELVAHKTMYTQEDFRHHTHSLHDIEALGFCAMAHDEGLPIEVESDYIPAWMYRGEWDEPEEGAT